LQAGTSAPTARMRSKPGCLVAASIGMMIRFRHLRGHHERHHGPSVTAGFNPSHPGDASI
jgi:hypothetical protein